MNPKPPRFCSKLIRTFRQILRKQRDKLSHAEDPRRIIEAMTQDMTKDGCVEDEIPGAYGEFGLCKSNPVPANGIGSGYDYLNRLQTDDGGRITFKRVGSLASPVSKNPIDAYQIFTESQGLIAIIYISPYQRKTSAKAPKGFVLSEQISY